MLTPQSFYQKKHGNEPFLLRTLVEKFAQEYHQARLKEDLSTDTLHSYEARRTQTVNLGVSKQSGKEVY